MVYRDQKFEKDTYKCENANDKLWFYYYQPICKRTGKMCVNGVVACKHKKDIIDHLVDQIDCIPEEEL
jgi:hypothetical protein